MVTAGLRHGIAVMLGVVLSMMLALRPASATLTELPVEDLGPMAWDANVTLGPLAPDPTGTGFVQLLFAFPGEEGSCRAPFEIVAVNLQTGAVSRTPASSQSGSVGWQVKRCVWGPDGKLYIGTNTPPHLICWDPKTQTARDLGRVWSDSQAVMVYSLALGTDGAIYGGGGSISKAFRYDPKTGQFQDLGVLGLPRTDTPAYAYSIGADERYVYVASGKIPWYIVAYDRQTGSQQNLLTFSQFDSPDIYQYPDGVYLSVSVAATSTQPASKKFYQLTGGKALPLDRLPPRPPSPSPLPATARPEVFLDKSTAGQTHTVTLWYRLPADKATAPNPAPADATPEQLGWRPVTVPVPCQPYQVRRLALLPNGRLVGATGLSGLYGDMFTFDPATGQHEVLGQPTSLNVYSMLVSDGKLFFSGYPNTPLCVYDPAQPWTFGKDTPISKAPDAQSPLSNPQRLLYFGNLLGTYYGYYMARDAQGRIYIGAHADQVRAGGGLAVYDPGTGQASGIGEPMLTNFDVSGLAATSNGRLIVYSSRVVKDPLNPSFVPGPAKLFVYDPAVGRFTKQWMPLPDRTDLGHLATGAPGQVVGAAPNGTNTTLYAVDVATGKLLWQRQAPGRVSRNPLQAASFSRGPDGQIWTFLDQTLVRIRPDTGEMTVVGTVSSGPGDIVFYGQDIYLAGADSLRRIRGVVPAQYGSLLSNLLSTMLALRPGSATLTELPVEDLGPMAWNANVTLGPLAPDPTGTGFVQLLFAFPGDDRTCRAPFEIVAVNLQTGAVSRTPASSQSGSVGWQVWGSGIWGPDGKLYLGTNSPPHLICWDPKSQSARDLGRVWSEPKACMVYSLALGTDGAIYGGGCNLSKAFRYDPKTGQFQDLGILGLPRTYGGPAYAYSIGADERYVYVASGKIPWYIVAYDRTTGSQQNLLTFSQFDFPKVIQYPDGVYASVTIAATDGQKERYEFYQLTGGKAIPVNRLPKRPPSPSPLPATARPEVFLDTSTAGQTRTVTLWYRLPADKATAPNPPPTDATPEQLGWRPVTVPVPCQPYQVRRLALLPNGRLVGATGDYGDMFTFDPATGQHEVLGQPTLLNIYSMLVSDGKLFFSGYPLVPLCVYDPSRPWTFGTDTPIIKAPDAQSPLSNPQRLLNFGTLLGTHYGYYMARDAQGRIYIGSHAERIRVGGGLAVYDPATGQTSGIGEPTLTNFDVSGLAATSDGRLIVYSSRVVKDPLNPTLVPPAAKLFVYDPAAGRFTKQWTPLWWSFDLGHLASGMPGQIVGAAPFGSDTMFYALDVATGKLLWQRQASGLIARDAYTSASFSRGPDGQIWTFLGQTLVRIRPDTGDVTTVGTVPQCPGHIVFVGKDIYLSGADSLRRIRGVVPDP